MKRSRVSWDSMRLRIPAKVVGISTSYNALSGLMILLF